jgi:menaquinone-dependent protoporphyrinogen oxidase
MDTSRRGLVARLLEWGTGTALVVASLAIGGLWRPEVGLARNSCQGRREVTRKVLVTYATRGGSTGEVAQAIAERLCASGLQAEVRPVEPGLSLQGWDAVLLGSAIRFGAWLPEMARFIEAHRAELTRIPVAIFTLHVQALGDDAASREARARYTQPVHALLSPRDEAFFAGKVDPATLSLFDRLAV